MTKKLKPMMTSLSPDPDPFLCLGTGTINSLNPSFFEDAYQLGIRTFDTGWGYGGGPNVSEKALAPLLKAHTDVKVIDKLPLFSNVLDGRSFEEVFQIQLKALGVEQIYAYLLHCPLEDPSISEEQVMEACSFLRKMREEGRIQKIGFSAHYDEYKMIYLSELAEWDIIMTSHSVIDFNPFYKGSKLEGPSSHFFTSYLPVRRVSSYVVMPFGGGSLFNVSDSPLMASYALHYLRDTLRVDHVVVGTSSLDHLKENIQCLL